MKIDGISDIDNKILEVIRDNARLNYSEIGELVGISRTSVKNRMDDMQAQGIIKGYQTIIDPVNAPSGIRFFMDIETRPDSYEEIVARLASNKMIRQIYGVSGECRIHAIGFASNSRNLEYFANAIYREQHGVRRISCHTVISTMMDVDGGVEYERYKESEHLEGTGN